MVNNFMAKVWSTVDATLWMRPKLVVNFIIHRFALTLIFDYIDDSQLGTRPLFRITRPRRLAPGLRSLTPSVDQSSWWSPLVSLYLNQSLWTATENCTHKIHRFLSGLSPRSLSVSHLQKMILGTRTNFDSITYFGIRASLQYVDKLTHTLTPRETDTLAENCCWGSIHSSL